jgi:hypothetical protein
MTLNNRKTQRKNKTKQVISWPSNDEYFTINDLVRLNPHMLTGASKPSDITIRVRLAKAVKDDNLVSPIGQKNCGKGRPKVIYAMRPVKQIVIEKATTDGISLDMPKIMTVMEITPQLTTTPIITNIVPNQSVNA